MHLRYGHPGRRAPAPLATGARAALCTLALLSAARALHAEDIAIFAGATDTDDHTSVSYSWQLEYRQRLLSYLDFSLAYLNEGHVPGHHRDGASAQLWAVTPRFGGHFDLALGAGPYFYFDSSWFARLNLSEVHTPGDEDTRTLLLGVGTSLDPLLQRFGEVGLSAPAGSELGLF